MLDLTKLPILNDNHEWLIDNDDYVDHLNLNNPDDYLIVYSFNSDFLETIQELIAYNIEFSHQPCHLSDESYLLINITQ
jgi:hypothetical protein